MLFIPKKTLALPLGILALVLATVVATAPQVQEKQLSVYAPVATYTLPVLDRSGREYVGLLELLEPLGRVSSQSVGGRWAIRYNAVDGTFVAGKTRGKIRGRDFDLGAPFLIENARGFVPLASLGSLLPRFLGAPVDFHLSGRRLFVGQVGIQASFHLDSGPQPRLVLNFNGPVNPTISTEPGRVRMLFKRDPVLSPGSQSISFTDKVITQATYAESNGTAEIDIMASSPLLATYSNSGKTITLAAAPTEANAGQDGTANPAGTTGPSQPKATPPPGAVPPAIRRPVIFVDAAHGGDERGAALSDRLAEKDVTLGFARLLRHELELRGFAVQMSREGDSSVPLDQRAGSANTGQAVAFITLHATSQGNGARVYTALLPREGESKGLFRAWNGAQEQALAVSAMVATAIVNELQVRKMAGRASPASLRPLNNVLMPAVAVELAPGPNGATDLGSATYQQQVASAIADGVVSVRGRLGVQR
ncbi:MAG TPA: N-acetylmuramoyl-L-alanine amidase [Terriglobales bacterium]|nr:N-acetylmuramoyl-L-alanine amidase [Terriglobales bacterium]